MNVASPPAALIWSTVSWPAASPYSATTTLAPCSANIIAATRPIPPPAPVMIETLSASRIGGRSSLSRHRTRGPWSLRYAPRMATSADMMAAVAAGDVERVGALLADDPTLVAARGDDGVPALLLARYRFDRPTMDAV